MGKHLNIIVLDSSWENISIIVQFKIQRQNFYTSMSSLSDKLLCTSQLTSFLASFRILNKE